MSEKEFNLSKRRIELTGFEEDEGRDKYQYDEVDIKEFIERLKARIFSPIFDSSFKTQQQIEDELIAEINKLAGDKLI